MPPLQPLLCLPNYNKHALITRAQRPCHTIAPETRPHIALTLLPSLPWICREQAHPGETTSPGLDGCSCCHMPKTNHYDCYSKGGNKFQVLYIAQSKSSERYYPEKKWHACSMPVTCTCTTRNMHVHITCMFITCMFISHACSYHMHACLLYMHVSCLQKQQLQHQELIMCSVNVLLTTCITKPKVRITTYTHTDVGPSLRWAHYGCQEDDTNKLSVFGIPLLSSIPTESPWNPQKPARLQQVTVLQTLLASFGVHNAASWYGCQFK